MEMRGRITASPTNRFDQRELSMRIFTGSQKRH
jgi:hypothetical protein